MKLNGLNIAGIKDAASDSKYFTSFGHECELRYDFRYNDVFVIGVYHGEADFSAIGSSTVKDPSRLQRESIRVARIHRSEYTPIYKMSFKMNEIKCFIEGMADVINAATREAFFAGVPLEDIVA